MWGLFLYNISVCGDSVPTPLGRGEVLLSNADFMWGDGYALRRRSYLSPHAPLLGSAYLGSSNKVYLQPSVAEASRGGVGGTDCIGV